MTNETIGRKDRLWVWRSTTFEARQKMSTKLGRFNSSKKLNLLDKRCSTHLILSTLSRVLGLNSYRVNVNLRFTCMGWNLLLCHYYDVADLSNSVSYRTMPARVRQVCTGLMVKLRHPNWRHVLYSW